MWVGRSGATAVVHVGGRLTADARRELRARVLDAIARGDREVVVDLTGAESLDTASLGVLVMLARRVRAHGGAFRLEAVGDGVRAVLALTRLDGVFLGADTHADTHADGYARLG